MSKHYWEQRYGKRSNEFIEGVIAGLTAYARWKDGTEYVGAGHETLKGAIEEAKDGMGYKTIKE